MDHENEDILEGLDDILGGAAEQPEPAPALAAAKRPRRTKEQMAKAAMSDLAAAAAIGPAEAVAAAPLPIDPKAKRHGFTGKRVGIIIERSHNPEDPPTVFLRLNDFECQITRGEPVEVYEEMLGVLNDARQTVFSQPASGVLVPHESLRFSYSRV